MCVCYGVLYIYVLCLFMYIGIWWWMDRSIVVMLIWTIYPWMVNRYIDKLYAWNGTADDWNNEYDSNES